MTTIEQQLKECLQKPYENAKRFLADVIFPVFGEDNFEDAGNANVLRMLPELQAKADATGIKDIRKVGDLLIEGSELGIFDITLDYKKQLQRNRVEVQQIVRSIIATHSGAFIIFHYESGARWEWRFTFCHKGASASESSDAKRYTFLLGPGQSCRTAAENFTKIHEKIEREGEFEMQDIISAFDVEALSKEFFAKYKNHYERFCQFVYENKNNRQFFGEQFSQWEDKVIRDYVKKLLGRIVFLHFIQKKGWLGVPADKTWNDGDRQFMKNLYNRASKEQKDNYLDIVLEPLFQKGLDRNRSAEGDIFDTGVEGFRNVKIPYLNGGLFERDVMDEPDSRFPSEYFGDLLEFLYEYNFTIDENDPNDAEVGVDPEMLGRIFENLLEDNKDKGAFYTPKEIVQYMCRESLIAYLTTNSIENGNTNPREAVEKAIRNLVLNPEEIVPKMNDKQKESFGEALRKVKICDPAIGSGAFPMGLLNELVRCRVAISAWAKDNDGNVLIDDYAALKREIVCNNIYGVDIERGAIDIARLRFWLSIVVDEKEPHALPNLDYKFMEGNSLIPTFDGQYINLDTDKQKHVNVIDMKKEKRQLYNLKQEHYNATGLRKHQLAVGIKDCILRLISLQLGYELRQWYEHNVVQTSLFPEDKPKQLTFADIKPTLPPEKQHICDLGAELRAKLKDTNIPIEERAQLDIRFFDWRMMFTEIFEGENPGFDIVIGNPPYFNVQTLGAKSPYIDAVKKKYSDIWQDKSDILFYFFRLALDLSKNNINFITSNAYPFSDKAKKMRNKLIEDGRMSKIVNFEEFMVFNSASITTCITMLCKNCTSIKAINVKGAKHTLDYVIKYIKNPQNEFDVEFHKDDVFALVSSEITRLNNKIDSKGEKLYKICKMGKGMETAADNVFLFDKYPHQFPSSCIKKRVTGKNMDRFVIYPDNKYILYAENYEDFANLPESIKQHLLSNEESLKNRATVKNEGREWWRYSRPMHKEYYKFSKLYCSRRSFNNCFCLDESNEYLGFSNMTVIFDTNPSYSIKYILGLLNSSLLNYRYKSIGKQTGGGSFEYFPNGVGKLPIAEGTEEQRQTVITLVDMILSAKKSNPSATTETEERKLDSVVYQIYGLSDEDIKIVENFGTTKENE